MLCASKQTLFENCGADRIAQFTRDVVQSRL